MRKNDNSEERPDFSNLDLVKLNFQTNFLLLLLEGSNCLNYVKVKGF